MFGCCIWRRLSRCRPGELWNCGEWNPGENVESLVRRACGSLARAGVCRRRVVCLWRVVSVTAVVSWFRKSKLHIMRRLKGRRSSRRRWRHRRRRTQINAAPIGRLRRVGSRSGPLQHELAQRLRVLLLCIRAACLERPERSEESRRLLTSSTTTSRVWRLRRCGWSGGLHSGEWRPWRCVRKLCEPQQRPPPEVRLARLRRS